MLVALREQPRHSSLREGKLQGHLVEMVAYSCRISISAHSHQTSARSSTFLKLTLLAFSKTLRALSRSGSA